MRLPFVIAAVLPLLAGCSGSSAVDAGLDDVDSGYVDCSTDPRVQAYAPGVSVHDAAGDRTYVLTQSEPSPPSRGINTWTVKVTDGSGSPVSNLNLGAVAFMPDHGHGTTTPTISAGGDGTYSIGELYFFMPGVWRVTVDDTDGGSTANAGVYFFCVEG